MGFNFIKVLTLLVLVTHFSEKTAAKVSVADKTKIQKGIEAGKTIANALKNGQFGKSLVSLGKNLSPFLGAIGPLASVALGFIPSGDSKELAYMKKEFKEVNNKLDIITSEFAEVKNAIDWSTVQVSYGAYERKIRAAEENLNKVYTADRLQDRRNNKIYFMQLYRSDFDNSLQKLYDAIMENDHVLSKNIIEAVIKYTKNHTRKVEQFSLGLVQLLVQAIKIKVAYYDLNGWSSDHIREEWQKKMNDLSTRLQQKIDDVKNAYQTQLETDLDDLIRENKGLGNEGLMQKIYDFVVDKYDWRNWFVAVYDDMHGYDKHTIWLCGGLTLLHKEDKNIIISSQDKDNSSSFKESEAASVLRGIENDIDTCHMTKPGSRARALVDNVGNKVGNSCVPYALRMAVRTNKGLHFTSLNSHRAHRRIDMKKCCGRNWLHKCHSKVSWHYDMLLFG